MGKSNILDQYLKHKFNKNSESTIGVSFATETIIDDNARIKVQIWDLSGQERYRSIATAHIRRSKGALLIYDITNHASFDNLEGWIENIRLNSQNEDVQIILIGNKSDLKNEQVVKTEEAILFAEKHNITFIEVSALNSSNIKTAFAKLVHGYLSNMNLLF